MIIARFQIHPERASEIAWNSTQDIIELAFPDVFDLIGFCKENEDDIVACTAIIDGRVIDLEALSA